MGTPLPLDPMLTLMLMPGTDMAATMAMDTGLMDTDTGTARGQLMRRPPPPDPTLMLRPTPMDGTATTTARGQLMMLPLLDPTPTLMLMLTPGTDITAMATPTTDMASAVMDTGDTTARNKKSEILLKMDF